MPPKAAANSRASTSSSSWAGIGRWDSVIALMLGCPPELGVVDLLLLGDVHLECGQSQPPHDGQRLDGGQVAPLGAVDVLLVIVAEVEAQAVLADVDQLQVVEVEPAGHDPLNEEALQRSRVRPNQLCPHLVEL